MDIILCCWRSIASMILFRGRLTSGGKMSIKSLRFLQPMFLLLAVLVPRVDAATVFSSYPDAGNFFTELGGGGLGYSRVSQQFSLTSSAAVSSMTISESVLTGGALPGTLGSTISVTISTGAEGVGPLYSGTTSFSSIPSHVVLAHNPTLYKSYDVTFSLPSVSLGPGNYYVTLSTDGNLSYWGASAATGLNSYSYFVTNGWSGPLTKEHALIVSSAAPIPEPEAYAMMLAGLGLLRWRGRRTKVKLN
jgi:hypothetical protein